MQQLNENQLKLKRIEAVLQLGELQYKKLRETKENPGEEIQNIINTIGELDLEIAKATGVWRDNEGCCPNCGGELGENSAFCSGCGYSIKEYTAQFIGNCKRCGARVKKEQNFCDVCGILLRD